MVLIVPLNLFVSLSKKIGQPFSQIFSLSMQGGEGCKQKYKYGAGNPKWSPTE
jgi:hypothetical protein